MTSLLPRPRLVLAGEGAVTWRSPLRVRVAPVLAEALDVFAEDLAAAVGWAVDVVDDSAPADLEIMLNERLGAEAYCLRVEDVTRVEAAGAAGASYALTTLRQLGPDELWGRAGQLERWRVPRVSVEDEPRFAWRGAHLDVARHFFDVATILRFVELLAAHRLNRLHLHLNDDQGWRVEIPGWPRLTQRGAQRRSSPVGHESEGRDDGLAHGGYFSAEDLAHLREYARRRHVMIVPEIDLPGHAQAAIAAYPELGCTSEPVEVWTRWGISEHVLNVEPVAFAFATDALSHVARLFPESPVHIGGDECPTSEWQASLAARRVMHEHGFSDVRQLQGLFTTRLAQVLHSLGHEVLAWDEVLDADVPAGTVIVAWRHADKGLEAARRGLDVIMAPMQWLYLDWLNSDRPDEPVAIAPPPAVTTWQRVYQFVVVPPELEAELVARVRGAQAQLWTEYIATREHLDYMAFPRLSAFSEVVWGTAGELDEFEGRLRTHLGRLDAMGVAYRRLDE